MESVLIYVCSNLYSKLRYTFKVWSAKYIPSTRTGNFIFYLGCSE